MVTWIVGDESRDFSFLIPSQSLVKTLSSTNKHMARLPLGEIQVLLVIGFPLQSGKEVAYIWSI